MKKIFRNCFLAFVIILMYLPIVMLAVYSFSTSSNMGAIHGFSINNYITLFTTPELRNMIVGTLTLALGSAAISTVLATLGAVGVFYSGKINKALIGTMNQVPITNADVVTGFSVCIFLIVVLGVEKDTFIPLVAGHVVLSAPFVYLSVMPKLRQMDSSLYEAALDLGATPSKALFKVVLPQIVPGITSGFMMAVTLSLDDYFVATYTKPATFNTISTYVVNATKGSYTEIKTALWALSTLIFVIVVLVVAAANLVDGRNRERMGGNNEKE